VTDERDISRRQAALLAFIGVAVTLLGVGIAIACGAPPDLLGGDDAAAAARKIAAAGRLFRIGVLGWSLVILGDVVRAWALYVFFRSIHRSIALLGAWWMLLHDAVFGFSLAGVLLASEVVAGAGTLASLPPETAHALLVLLLKAHLYGFHLGLLFFSFHLLLNGCLVLASPEVPRVLGALLILASLGYLVDSASRIAVPSPPPIIAQIVMVPNTIGELALMVWLAFRGGRAPRAAGSRSGHLDRSTDRAVRRRRA
jgi:hypothetical protein